MQKINLWSMVTVAALSSCTRPHVIPLQSSSVMETGYIDLVDPFIGTNAHGHTYPGASLPFGMVQLSPDTHNTGWDWCSGYHYTDKSIMGFSHTHLSGTGCSDYGDILLMPTVGKLQIMPGDRENPDSGYRSRFKHKRETASPGYYSVWLDDYNIKAELTVTKRVGFHRYTFPKTKSANIIVDLTHSMAADRQSIRDLSLKFVNNTEIQGLRRSEGWAKDQYVYFVAKFSRPFETFGMVVDDRIIPGQKQEQGKNLKAFVKYSTSAQESILIKVGISAVSAEGARKNLEMEIPDWDFDRVHNAARKIWSQQLRKIKVEGGTQKQRTIFYTALYHTSLAPNLFMDVDGRYRGMDYKVHKMHKEKNGPEFEFEYYTVFSLWDTFRATHPLFTIIERDRTVDFIKTLIAKYREGGILPMWELAGNYTECMNGYHAVSVIVDAYMKDIKNFDVATAYEAMTHSAEQDRLGLKSYKKMGYIPADSGKDSEKESVSKVLEYAYDDWCIAKMAQSMGKKADYQKYNQRSQFYKNVFDPSTGFMRGKNSNGEWKTPFDPLNASRKNNPSYTEGNAWQHSWFVPHDVPGLIALLGGKKAFTAKLDALFDQQSDRGSDDSALDMTGMIGQYAHGNEPSHHVPYLYNYAGLPWRTQERVREIMKSLYTAQPDGLCGNEDCGQMSAWYILSAIGFYPVCPCLDIYAIGSPIFNKVIIDLDNGKQFVVKAKNVSSENKYIQSITLNGQPYRKLHIKHADIINGSEFVFTMGALPNKNRIL